MKTTFWKSVSVVVLIAAGVIAIGFYPSLKLAGEAKSDLLPLMIWRDAAMATRRVEMAENIRAGNTDAVLEIIESQLYMDRHYLSENIRHADNEQVKDVEAAIARIEGYQRQFESIASYIEKPRSLQGLGRSAKYLPHFENGEKIGLRVSSINPHSFLAEIGLEEGDVIVAVDDQRMSNPDTLMLLTEVLSESSNFTLVVISAAGSQRTIQFPNNF